MKDDIKVNVHTTKALCHSKFSLKYECSLCGTTPYSCCTEPSFAHHLVVGIHSKHACVPLCSVTSSAWYVWMGRNARPFSLSLVKGVVAFALVKKVQDWVLSFTKGGSSGNRKQATIIGARLPLHVHTFKHNLFFMCLQHISNHLLKGWWQSLTQAVVNPYYTWCTPHSWHCYPVVVSKIQTLHKFSCLWFKCVCFL